MCDVMNCRAGARPVVASDVPLTAADCQSITSREGCRAAIKQEQQPARSVSQTLCFLGPAAPPSCAPAKPGSTRADAVRSPLDMQNRVLSLSCYSLMLLLSASGMGRPRVISALTASELPAWVGGLLIHVAVVLVVRALSSTGYGRRIPLLHACIRLLPKLGCLSYQHYAQASLAACCKLRGLLRSLTAGGSYVPNPTVPWAIVAGLQVATTSVLYAVSETAGYLI